MSLIMFDFDGTIADSFKFVLDFMAREAGLELRTADVENYRYMSMKDMALKLGIPFWRLPFLYFKGRRVMRSHILRVQPIAGMPEVIKQLSKDGHKIGIVSSNSNHNIRKFLKTQGLNEYVQSVRGGAGLLGKVGLIKQLQRKFRAQDSWYIGDETTDVASAKATNCHTIAVSWGFAARDSLERHEPDALIDEPAQIVATIEAHGK